MFDDIEGVERIVDDLLIWGKDQAEHDMRLVRALDRASEMSLTLNRNKCRIGLTELP